MFAPRLLLLSALALVPAAAWCESALEVVGPGTRIDLLPPAPGLEEASECGPGLEAGWLEAWVRLVLGTDARLSAVSLRSARDDAGRDVRAAFALHVCEQVGREVTLRVKTDPSKLAGAGDVDLRLRGESEAGSFEGLELLLRQPPVRLSVPAKYTLDCRGLWGRCPPPQDSGLPVALASGEGPDRASVAARFELPLEAADGAFVDSPRFPEEKELTREGYETFDLDEGSVSGLDVGTYTGTIVVEGALAERASVAFELKRRGAGAWILVLAGVGVLLGWLVRTHLQRLVDHGRAELRYEEVRRRIHAALAIRPEVTFEADARALLDRLGVALRELKGADAAKSAEAAKEFSEVQADLAKAISRFEGRREEVLLEVAALDRLLNGVFLLPRRGQSVVNAGLAALVKVRGRAMQDADGAKTELIGLRRHLLAEFVAFTQSLQDGLAEPIQRLARPAAPLPEGAAAGLRARVASLREKLGAPPPASADDTETIRGQVVWVHEIVDLVVRLVGETTSVVVVAAERSVEWLRSAPAVPDHDALDGALELAGRLRDFDRERLLEGTESVLDDWIAALVVALKALGAAIRAQVDPVPTSVDTALLAGRYVEAASAVATTSPPAGPGAARTRPPAGREPGAERLPSVTPMLASTAAAMPNREAISAPVQVDVPATRRAIMRALGFQTFLSGLGLVGIGYLIFEPSYFGTLRDCATILGWGFTLDVGVGSLVARIGSDLPAGS